MPITRREFVRDGIAVFTISFAAPAFLSDLARAQGRSRRNLVVLYLGGGNDALSTLIPYNDEDYRRRRPTIAIPAANVLQIGTDKSGVALGLNQGLTGLETIFNSGRLALIQRTGYPNSSRSHFLGTDIWSTADPSSPQGTGWLGRYLDQLPSPVDPLTAWSTHPQPETPRTLVSRTVAVPRITSVATYGFDGPNGEADRIYAREAATRISSHIPVNQPHLAFVNATAQAAFATMDKVGTVGTYVPTVAYPGTAFGGALRMIAGAIAKDLGTKIFWVTTGGYDTHASQNPNLANGNYTQLMTTLNGGLFAFYSDLLNQGLLNDTLIIQFSEFGRRVFENASNGTDHGAGGLMMAIGGTVRGGIYGTSARLREGHETLENNNGDVRFETDFRSVYSKVIDAWLGGDSLSVLGGDYRGGAPAFL